MPYFGRRLINLGGGLSPGALRVDAVVSGASSPGRSRLATATPTGRPASCASRTATNRSSRKRCRPTRAGMGARLGPADGVPCEARGRAVRTPVGRPRLAPRQVPRWPPRDRGTRVVRELGEARELESSGAREGSRPHRPNSRAALSWHTARSHPGPRPVCAGPQGVGVGVGDVGEVGAEQDAVAEGGRRGSARREGRAASTKAVNAMVCPA